MSNKPVKSFRAGACNASVFANERKGEVGPVKVLTIAFSCRYRDEATGEWKDAASMRPNEVARAVLVLEKALEFCWLHAKGSDEAPE